MTGHHFAIGIRYCGQHTVDLAIERVETCDNRSDAIGDVNALLFQYRPERDHDVLHRQRVHPQVGVLRTDLLVGISSRKTLTLTYKSDGDVVGCNERRNPIVLCVVQHVQHAALEVKAIAHDQVRVVELLDVFRRWFPFVRV